MGPKYIDEEKKKTKGKAVCHIREKKHHSCPALEEKKGQLKKGEENRKRV